ncbi:hypothetical protein EJ05DRAFT_537194 [Pseudovirgaria hyperparasitica]|uniref:Uncharacterized protein n=1 Tax=Pseudovirgaria hyperparasitica TaxID=470096 RepID=A0A6A6WEK3_9PEZI|nr:uncharacterized protein EJ05DRAFT_537194 [Pseudovirgaria hyperparasitica]KAF2760017.1 hypothetical protein EJ05DRAFT_537194 [Pseudovirgaria hyperparasitica]
MAVGHMSKPLLQRRSKGGTETTRKHRFKGFSYRIQNLKIEPIRRDRRHDFDDTGASHFQTALAKWRDSNLSSNYVAFAAQIDPYCETLPQILHNQSQIVELLVEYIGKLDVLSLQPLLDLVAQLAHDLGARFEDHFEKLLIAVTSVAARHEDVEAIEWSFNCLAWLFKYLSKLLVPNLTPLYDWLAPLLGKQHQKHYVPTFAAEALSFLLRKASQRSNKESLHNIIRHILTDVNTYQRGSLSATRYQHGVMTLFAESIKGVQYGIHSGAENILQELIQETLQVTQSDLLEDTSPAQTVLCGTIVNVIHATTVDTFAPLLKVIVGSLEPGPQASEKVLNLCTQLILVVCGVRKGSRVSDWAALANRVDALREHVEQACKSQSFSPKILYDILSCLAVVLHGCSLDIALPYVHRLGFLTSGQWLNHFLPFCILLSNLNHERFTFLALPHLQKFIVHNWKEQGDQICLVVPRLANSEVLSKSLQCPSEWQSAICDLSNTIGTKKAIPKDSIWKLNSRLILAEQLPFQAEQKQVLAQRLMDCVASTFNDISISDGISQRFYLGKAFEFATTQSPGASDGLHWNQIEQASSQLTGLTTFWTAVRAHIQQHHISFGEVQFHSTLLSNLRKCLSSPSHKLRLTALEILKTVVDGKSECMDHAIAIETCPLDLENARNIALRIRNLATAYRKPTTDAWTSKSIPSYLFGILHFRLSQAWDDSVNAIKEISTTKDGEDAISILAFEWLNPPVPKITTSPEISYLDEDVTSTKATNLFECFNHLQLQQRIQNYHYTTANPDRELSLLFETSNVVSDLQNQFCRTQALKVLNGIPEFAEKRNRSLVPVLLDWAGRSDNNDSVTQSKCSNDVVTLKWDRRDQKSLLSLFAQFNNPRVLYESDKVRVALLSLLTNADVEIQKPALRALLAWKEPQILRYEEDLFKLLDDMTFRDQLSIFLGVEEGDKAIRTDDHDRVMPIILRILYGKLVLREGSASGKQGQKARRKAVFTLLSRTIDVSSGRNDFSEFLTLALGKLDGICIIDGDGLKRGNYDKLRQIAEPRKLYGLLNMFEDMLDTLRTKINPFLSRIADPLLFCFLLASQSIPEATSPGRPDQTDTSEVSNSNEGLLRSMRQAAQRCLNLMFSNGEEFAWAPYATVINEEIVLPRLDRLPVENAHSISGMLRLFSTWSSSPSLATFLAYPPTGVTILGQVGGCLIEPSAQTEVKLFIVNEIIRPLLATATIKDEHSTENQKVRKDVRVRVLGPQISTLLLCLAEVIRCSPKKDMLDATILCVAELAPFVSSSDDAVKMIRISAALLKEPARKVSPKTKHNLLLTLHSLVPLCDSQSQYAEDGLYDVICSLFEYFRDRDNRILLSTVLEQITVGTDIHGVALLCQDLNSFDPNRLDEPDFERRSAAFRSISEPSFVSSSSLRQWQPVVYNALFHINDVENLSVRLDASSTLRRFVEAKSNKSGPEEIQFQNFIHQAVLPSLQKGIKQAPELVRCEHLSVLAHVVSNFPEWSLTNDMYGLLAGNDSEASFFNNVLHIQQHRRLRALRRLSCEANKLSSASISKIFLPLLDHFVFDPVEDETAHNLALEATNTMTALVQGLEWPQYRAVFTRYVDSLVSKPGLEKPIIKLIGAVTDGLTQAFVSAKRSTDGEAAQPRADDPQQPQPMEVDSVPAKLAETLPKREVVSRDLTSGPISKLTQYIHNKDETDINLRIPVAVAVVKLLKVLPTEEFYGRLPAVLLDICQILRSKSQDARDMTRKTLAEIASLIGPHCFSFLLKEMRTALPRGYQLHVLSFTMHSILVAMTDKLIPGDLDYCLPQIVDVIMDGIFGVTGQEKDAEDYISKMKEVKSQKNFDSMELLAKTTSLAHLIDLIRPIQSLLLEKLDFQMSRKIDDLLRRVETGLAQNEVSKQQGILQFCYDVIQEAASSEDKQGKGIKEKDHKTKRYLISMKGARHNHNKGAITSQMHKLARFSLELLRLIMKRYDHLHTPANLAGFLPIIGDSLLSGHEEVQLAAIKLLTRIIRVPLNQIDENGPVYVSTAYSIVRSAPNMSTELAQAAMKLISAIIRDREALAVKQVKETQLAYLLNRLKPDLRQPDRQGVAFNFIRAILGRKIVITEIYDIMDTEVSNIMITNQTGAIRDHARGVFVQFFTNYPQSKDRFKKQIGRLIKNLSYEHPEGRRSVMEVLNDILTNKNINSELLSEVLMSCFLGLTMTIANDTSGDCKEMAKVLIKRVFEKADESTSKDIVSQLKLYIDSEKPPVRSLGVQLYSLFIETNENNNDEVAYFLDRLEKNVTLGLEDPQDGNWEMVFRSLRALSQISQAVPVRVFSSKNSSLWSTVISSLTYPHTWVKESSAQALQHLLSDFARANKESSLAPVPLHGSNGLVLDGDSMVRIAKGSLKVLRTQEPRDELALSSIRNLLFLGKAFAANELRWPASLSDAVGEDNEQDASESEKETEQPTAIIHLMNSLSIILRRPLPAGTPARPPSLIAKTHALTLTASLATHLPLDTLAPSLPSLLRPLLVLTSPSTTHPSYPHQDAWTTSYKKLLEGAGELLVILREKVGDINYATLMRRVEKDIRDEREKRGVKRRLDRVREPEVEEARKRKKREKQKVVKREKGQFRRKRNGRE